MKRVAVISFTRTGKRLGESLQEKLGSHGYEADRILTERMRDPGDGSFLLEPDGYGWLRINWERYDAFLFISAMGIAVRMIAPLLKDKLTDPAVVVLDERAEYAISVVSGHVGGANMLARAAADVTGAVPVVTTATDIQKKFAVDVFAEKNGLILGNRNTAKLISAAVLEDRRIGIYSAYPFDGDLPGELELVSTPEELGGYPFGIYIGPSEWGEPGQILSLYPKNIAVGIGCRKGIGVEQIRNTIENGIKEIGISRERICIIASIDLKKEEAGILAAKDQYQVPFVTYSAEELEMIHNNSEESLFVKRITGVGNVCERAAILACERSGRGGVLIRKKEAGEGVTSAFAEQKWSIRFE